MKTKLKTGVELLESKESDLRSYIAGISNGGTRRSELTTDEREALSTLQSEVKTLQRRYRPSLHVTVSVAYPEGYDYLAYINNKPAFNGHVKAGNRHSARSLAYQDAKDRLAEDMEAAGVEK